MITLNPKNFQNYRTVLNPSFTTNRVEKVVAKTIAHIHLSYLHFNFQPAYIMHILQLFEPTNNTSLKETKMVQILLDFSAASDTVDQSVQLACLTGYIGATENMLRSLDSYLS